MSDRISIAELRDKTHGGFWTIHCDTIAALVEAIDAAREYVSYGGDLWTSNEPLKNALARFDFGDGF